MTIPSYNINVVTMIPDFIDLPGAPWRVLPVGIHNTALSEVQTILTTNRWRKRLFDGLVRACGDLAHAGCVSLYLNGSFATAKSQPGDYDACWHPKGVDRTLLDPVFSNFSNGRAAQKAKYGGEFFPSTTKADRHGRTFVEFFQVEKFTGLQKGILLIDLTNDPMLKPRVTP